MKKSSKVLIGILSSVVLAILVSTPFAFLFGRDVNASTDVVGSAEVIGTFADVNGDDYVFVILDELSVVPLAAAPTQSYTGAVSIAVAVSLIFAAFLCYMSWYLIVCKNISKYSGFIPNKELSRILPDNSFLHPVKLSLAEKEIESLAVFKFF